MSEPAESYRRVAAEFTATVDAVESLGPDAWDRPAPPEGWTARDVVGHLVEWFPGFLVHSVGIELEAVPSVADDPAAAWRSLDGQVQALLDDPAVAAEVRELPHLGTMPVGDAIDMVFTGDVFLHQWDLGTAIGQVVTLDPERCETMLAGMLPMEDAMRSSDHYGPPVAVPDDADIQTRLLGFIGRRA